MPDWMARTVAKTLTLIGVYFMNKDKILVLLKSIFDYIVILSAIWLLIVSFLGLFQEVTLKGIVTTVLAIFTLLIYLDKMNFLNWLNK